MWYCHLMAALRMQLARWGRQTCRARLLCETVACITVAVMCVALACMLDHVLRLSGVVRSALALLVVSFALVYAWRRIVHTKLWRMPAEQVARALEEAHGIADNALINACQFEGSAVEGVSRDLAQAVVAQGVQQAELTRPAVLCQPRRLRRVFAVFGVCTVVSLVYFTTWPNPASTALRRLARPWADIPPASAQTLVLQPSGRKAIYEGDSVALRVTLRQRPGESNPTRRFDVPQIRLSRGLREGVAEETRAMTFVGADGLVRNYLTTLEAVRTPLVVRCWSGDACSQALRIEVHALPRIIDGSFVVTPPAYTGWPSVPAAGPPAPMEVVGGSRVRLVVTLDRPVEALVWRCGQIMTQLRGEERGRTWRADLTIASGVPSGPYTLAALLGGRERVLAGGVLAVRPDALPEVSTDETEPQRLAWPGETLAFSFSGRDDFGVRALAITVNDVKSGERRLAKRWDFGAAPGPREAAETYLLAVEGALFQAGEAYALTAYAIDFAGQTGTAERVLLRVRRPADTLAATENEARHSIEALQRAIDEQRRALGLTRTLELHLVEAVRSAHLPQHAKGITTAQTAARKHGREAVAHSAADTQHASAHERLKTVVEFEMGWALETIPMLETGDAATCDRRVSALATRQVYILEELIRLQGRIAANARQRQAFSDEGITPSPAATAEERARELQDLLHDFLQVQRRIIEQSQQLAERKPEDLSEEELEILGQLAREEAKWAAFLKDKLNDLAKNPLQDFADGSLADEFNEVWQDVQKAAAELYEKKVELAVPLEQSGLESAEELVNNLERWLPDKPDYLKWLMEDPATTPDAPLAELPGELEDIVGALLDQEEAMTEDVEDVTSGWIDSIDKGAGWDAMDGPISSMSAKGVTGNLLPNQQEIGGRSGEGRTGRSTGQMVESAAEGKDGRQTPSRLSDTPFESGQVDDQAKQDSGGASGGGKLSGFGEKGLRGPSSVPRLDGMKRLAGKQAEIRQQAERLSLHLRARGLPSGDLGSSVTHMHELEEAALRGDGAVIRQAFDATLARVRDARTAVGVAERVRREAAGLSRREADELWSGLRDDIPPGYEAVVGAYYRRVTERGR